MATPSGTKAMMSASQAETEITFEGSAPLINRFYITANGLKP